MRGPGETLGLRLNTSQHSLIHTFPATTCHYFFRGPWGRGCFTNQDGGPLDCGFYFSGGFMKFIIDNALFLAITGPLWHYG